MRASQIIPCNHRARLLNDLYREYGCLRLLLVNGWDSQLNQNVHPLGVLGEGDGAKRSELHLRHVWRALSLSCQDGVWQPFTLEVWLKGGRILIELQ